MNPVNNQKGFQLLEVLLSISLLSIVILVFFGFFIQSKSFSAQSQKIGSASQLSQEILQRVRDSGLTSENAHIVPNDFTNWEVLNLKTENWETLYPGQTLGEFLIDRKQYFSRVKVVNAAAYSQYFALTNQLPPTLDIIFVEIETDKNGKRIKAFETYGYKERVNSSGE